MKKFTPILFFLLSPVLLFPQASPKEDSLLRVLPLAKHDTERVKILYELTEVISDPIWLSYNEQLLQLTQGNKDALSKNDPLRNFYLLYYARGLDSKGVAEHEKGNTSAALVYFYESLQINQQLGNKEAIASSSFNIGSAHQLQGDIDKAAMYFKKCLQTTTDKETIGNCLNNLGLIYEKRGDIYNALDYHHKSLKMRMAIDDKKGIASSLNNIGVIYFNLGDLEKTEKYFQQSLQLQKILGDKKALANSFHNMSTIYSKQENIPKAMEYAQYGLQLQKTIDDKKGMAASYDNIAVLYGKQNKLSEAMDHTQKALAIQREISDKASMPSSLYIIGNIYKKQGDLKQASVYLQQSLALSQEIGFPSKIRDAAELLKDIYTQQRKYPEALEMYELFIRMRDSILNEEAKKAGLEKQYQFEYEKKENALKKEQEKKDALREEEIRQKNYLVYGGSIIALLSVVIAFLVIRQDRLHTRQQTLELEQKLLRVQMNPHFIFNVFNSIQSYIYKKDSLNAGMYMSRFAELTRMILENSRHNYISLEQEIKGLNHYLQLQQLRFEDRFDYSIETDPQLDPAAIAIPPMLAQPFIENALEHGIRDSEKGKIALRFFISGEDLVMEIEDNGIGIERSKAAKQGSPDGHTSLATVITSERISVLNRQIAGSIRMHISDLRTEGSGRSGTMVVFHIPCQAL